MTSKKRILSLACVAVLLLLSGTQHTAAQDEQKYKFDLTIDGNHDSVMYLGFYYANSQRVLDTAVARKPGRFHFEGKKKMHPGLYFFVNKEGRYVEFVIYNEVLKFRFHTDEADWTKNMVVSGSHQNELFYNFHRQTSVIYDEVARTTGTFDSADLAHYRQRQARRIDTVRLGFIRDHPESMLSKMMLATKEVEVPKTDSNGNELNNNQRWQWWMNHYWDNVSLNDNFIIRTPKSVFYNLVVDYTDKYMKGLPPSMICPLLDTLIDRAEPAPEVYGWLVSTLTEKYLQSNVMVYDEVYVHLAQRYYGGGKATWANPTVIDEVVERANRWERLLVGKEAPELILSDTNRRAYSLHHMPGKYTLLVFWSPTCGHCREIIPKVYEVFDTYAQQLDLTAYAILSEFDSVTTTKWHKFLKKHEMTNPRWINLFGGEANVDWHEVYDISSTPQIYLIENKQHTFIAKKMNAAIFEDICKNLLKNKQ